MNLFVIFSLVFAFGCAESYKVLVIYPLPVKSLSILGQGIARHLTNAGHEVTYVTVYPSKTAQKFRQIDISGNEALLDVDSPINNISYIMEKGVGNNDPLYLQELAIENAKLTFENENMKTLLGDRNEKFDVVVADLYESEIYSALAVLYDCPMIWVYSMGAHWHVLQLIDEPTNPAYDPDYLSSNLFPFSFLERVEELGMRIKIKYYESFIIRPKEEALYQKHFKPLVQKRGRTLPDYEDVVYNASFIFGNDHNAVKNIPSTPQNFKNVGGFHIEVPVKPLPKDLQDLMENSKEGVIYFSMGTFWKSKNLPKVLVTGLLEMFGKLKQTVIWKFEQKLQNVPKNVHIVEWAPQPSILAHPNCLFFITHGGLLSSIETIHFGVPTIGIPIYLDQFINVNKAVASGYALKANLAYDLPANLKIAIDKMLRDNSYSKKAKELSAIYHDRIVSPGVELVHWVQHVVRTKGATHLRSPALHMPFYQKLYLDLLTVVASIFISLLILIKKLFSVIFKKNVVPDKKKLNKLD